MKKTLLLLLVLSFRALHAQDDAHREALQFFESQVRPLLAERCYECHGEKKKKGSLRLDNIAYINEGGDSGPALVAGKPDDSLMIKAVRYTDPDFQMPPKKQLSAEQVAILEKWVKLGAPWPEAEAKLAAVGPDGFSAEARNFWCFQPLRDPQPPALPGNTWVRNDIDRFIAAKLDEQHLAPAPEADRRELVRRLYFDVHGLPPTREQTEAFVQSQDPQAYEKLVDELLASPRYGERWAQHWLDLVRYAESDGYNQDAYRAAAWPYRDWVIQALNTDMPYDRFVKLQLAGDEIAPRDPDALTATGYLRNPIYEYNERDVHGQWDIILNDMTDNAAEVFLGLSYGCARCHDHKFDPILQKDYFRLKGFFAPVLWRDDLKRASDTERAAWQEKQTAWETATADIRAQMDAMTHTALEHDVRVAHDRFTEDLQAMTDKPFAERGPLERQLAGICERQLEFARSNFQPARVLKTDADKARYKDLEEKLKAFDAIKPAPLPEAFVATDAANTAPPVVLKTRKGETEVAPGFLTLLAPGDPKIEPLASSTGRRTVLANWIARPDNQLVTRVIVNRVWGYHFGRGLFGTPNDMGKLGERPTHPELLDWLARKFVAEGWSLKKLHREILLSATYRQTAHIPVPEVAAKIDPANKFLWRFSPRRLEAEEVRDAMLMASGELDLQAGGPSTDGNGTRRSVYTMKKRNSPTELLHALDAPAGFQSSPDRQSTTTPTQALLLVNGDWPLARAQKLAARAATPEEAWQFALGRAPTPGEAQLAREFLERHRGAPEEAAPAAAVPEDAAEFHENTAQERLISNTPEEEGGEFTVEAIVRLESIDTKAAVRTIASRWNNSKDTVEGYGWSLGVTGEKSRFKPRNLIMQLVGNDENENIAYEVAASDLRVELGHTYHVVAKVSCLEHTVSFQLQEVGATPGPVQTAVRPHPVRSKLDSGASGLSIGGVNKRQPPHQWDGRIEAVRVARGLLPDDALSLDPTQWHESMVLWNAKAGPGDAFTRDGQKPTATASASTAPMTDLCHVLLNTNEFFYLH